MRPLARLVAAIVALVAFTATAATAATTVAFDTTARAAWVYDVTTGTVLMEKNAEQPLPPASMSKLMTLYLVFDALKEGRIQMDTQLPVSTKARQMQGSTMFLDETDQPTINDLIKGIIVLSGNDACVVVAEGLAGTESAFARKMNARAKELGLTQSHFVNSSGWPDPEQRMSARDLGLLALHLIEDFPDLYKEFSLREFPFDNRAPSNRFNRNPLLTLDIGADGLKTGHTQEAGYGLVGSAIQDGRRIIFVLNGLDSERIRAEESSRIVNWAFREFSVQTVVPQGETVLEVPVWMGSRSRLALTTEHGFNVLIPAGASSEMTAEVVYQGPIEAPVEAGARLGELVVQLPGGAVARTPLIASSDVEQAGFLGRMKAAVMRLGLQAWDSVASRNG